MRALIAPDKFKGSLTARQVADAIAHGLHTAGIETVILPLADGGDGSVEAALSAGYHRCQTQVRGADGRTVNAVYALGKRTAVVEVANTCGLSTLPAGVRAPMTSSTFGFGEAILAAYHAGARRIVLALGGSASTDGGAGMLAALGVVLLGDHGNTVEPDGAGLSRIARVDTTNMVDLSDVEVIVAGDVTNPLLGPTGAAATFGPQKGADTDQITTLEAGLTTLVRVLPSLHNRVPAALAEEPGAGAAGGLGFACRWLGGQRVPGADYFLDLLHFDQAVHTCDIVITGEGSIDDQTLKGKLPAVVAKRSAPRPVYAVVGRNRLTPGQQHRLGLQAIQSLSALTPADPSHDTTLSTTLATRAGRHIAEQLLSQSSPHGWR
jgi:glycerate 2-kinase